MSPLSDPSRGRKQQQQSQLLAIIVNVNQTIWSYRIPEYAGSWSWSAPTRPLCCKSFMPKLDLHAPHRFWINQLLCSAPLAYVLNLLCSHSYYSWILYK